jgi:aspartyl-tRNA(Asn)/glutamyl-tRNA(Gln) amidotransferase subunit A
MSDPALLSATELARQIAQRDLSATDAVEAVLARIERLNGRINAFALLDTSGARQAAQAADAKQAAGELLGPLHGAPFHAKDLLDTAGLETSFGSWLMEGNVPDQDAECVRRMKAAGAILIGKTTTPEFAGSVLTQSPRYGATANPWNTGYTSGGSSGGAAAAVAAGFGPLGLSTDGAGSARIPASCCGILGLKPTLGLVPHERAPDLFANYSHIGLQTRTSADLALMLNALSGPFSADPWTIGRNASPVSLHADPASTLKGRRAVFLPRMGNPQVSDDVLEQCQASLHSLKGIGLNITIQDQALNWGIETSRVMMRGLMSARMGQFKPEQLEKIDPAMRASIAEGMALDAEAIKAAPIARTALFHQVEGLLADADYILTPTLSAPAPPIDFDPIGILEIDGEQAGNLRAAWFTYPTPFNLTGHPALSIPSGRSADGLPIGLQAVTAWENEQFLVDIASAMEVVRPWGDEWPCVEKS